MRIVELGLVEQQIGWEGCCIEACSHRATGTCVRTRPAIGRGGGGNQHSEGSGHGRVHAQLAQMALSPPPTRGTTCGRAARGVSAGVFMHSSTVN